MLRLFSFLENRQDQPQPKTQQELPEGSALTPLLFVLYIDSLNDITKMMGKMKDITGIVSNKRTYKQQTLHVVTNWKSQKNSCKNLTNF